MTSQDVHRLADTCAEQLPAPAASFAEDLQAFAPALTSLIDAVRQTDARFAFDRDGRPGAIAAIRTTLPSLERELLDAVLEDHACEMAATQEALYQLALANARLARRAGA